MQIGSDKEVSSRLDYKLILDNQQVTPRFILKKYLKKFGFLKYNYKICRTENERKQYGK